MDKKPMGNPDAAADCLNLDNWQYWWEWKSCWALTTKTTTATI